MNILFTIYKSLGYGGAEVSTRMLAERLTKRGHKVIIASTQDYQGLDTRKFKEFHKIPFYSYQEHYLSKFLEKLMIDEKIDIVHSQDRLTSIPAVIAARKAGIKSIVHFRDYWYACPRSSCLTPDNQNYDLCSYSIILRKFPFYRWPFDMYKWHYLKSSWKVLEQADAKICSSVMEKNKLKLCNVLTNVNVIPISREVGFYSKHIGDMTYREKYKLKNIVVSCVGSLFYTKGVSVLVKIIPMVLKENKNISFLIVGDGPMMKDLQEMIKVNSLENNVILTGRLPLEEIPKIYSSSDIVIQPVIWKEPFSGVPIEVMASKKPLISSDIGAIQEMTDDFKILVQPFDYGGWKNAIIKLAKDKKLRERLAETGYKAVKKKYDNEVVVSQIEGLYNKLINAKY
ncbi:glycosyltransferase family 4 protein [Candidatus Woesearchaeota archaeon]|nr:glycosyltransferase family 4 protein [Candidatus Woesearchaeota archaeon]